MPDVKIGTETFTTKKAATTECQNLLYSGGIDEPIENPANIAFLSDLLHSRPEKVAELEGANIIRWGRQRGSATICFAVRLDNGNEVHFSFPKSIDALWHAARRAA